MATERDHLWEGVAGGIQPDDYGRRISIEVRGASGHRVGHVFVVDPHNEPYFGAVMDRIVREIDKVIHS